MSRREQEIAKRHRKKNRPTKMFEGPNLNSTGKCMGCNYKLCCSNTADNASEGVNENGIRVCFVQPNCSNCSFGEFCKDKGLPGVVPGVNFETREMTCFKGYHSEK